MRIALDVMGGDQAPSAPLEAAVEAHARGLAEILLVGPTERITAELTARGHRPEQFGIVEASEVVAQDEHPVAAIRHKQDSSLVRGIRMVGSGEADAFVSAGSTGALMAGSVLLLGTIKGVERPALSGVLPTLDGHGCLVLDLGANADASARNLLEFAVMASVYAERLLGWREPTVGLLNIGSEPVKGNRLAREAFETLQTYALTAGGGLATPAFRFVGNVEPRDVFAHPADIVVSDGFTGNVFLKTVEGVAGMLFTMIRRELQRGARAQIGGLLAMPALKNVGRGLSADEGGGAPLLGIRGVVIKCHGNSGSRAIANGISVAAGYLREGVGERIEAALRERGQEA